MDWKASLNLPDPDFTIPMKANLPVKEVEIQTRWKEMDIYHRIQEHRKDAPVFVYHDGPPYTNSPIHLGTALNKLLKDFVIKSRTLLGYRVPYVPGFDNHGLPIEQAVMKDFAAKKITPDVVTLRQACRTHAAKYIALQTEQFSRLGVFGLWEKPYTTMDFRFEAAIVRVFRRLAEAGYVYRGLRPTQWSPTSRTALADTEIVYRDDHTSTSIYVRFPLRRDPNQILHAFPHLYAIIWTTTPWTIPGNLAIAFHPSMVYSVVKVGDVHYVLLEAAVERIAKDLGWESYETVLTLDGINFDHMVFGHPIFDRDSLGVVADYITSEDGTGVVHTAPGHGRDDFYTGVKYGLPILCPVNERGVLTAEAGEFEGVFYKDCDTKVVERLQEVGNLLASAPYVHSYPYAERDDQPVIFRATEQWFVAIDHDNLRGRMLDEIEKVTWRPASGENRIRAMVSGRPDWCISRQRPWGVGIPIFYGVPSGKPVLDPVAIEAAAHLVETQGSDAWFSADPKDILPEGYIHPETSETEFRKETDVLDVWFDSGSTSLAVFEGEVEGEWKEPWPYDLCLEGSDQHRGWFNSSLTIGTAVRGQAPYKEVVTHGFVNDEHGRKMSKRLGNVIDPVEVCGTMGADVLRYWAASVDWQNDVPCYPALLTKFGEEYRTVRNTLRFLLGNLYDFGGCEGALLDFDEWIIEQSELLASDCADAYLRCDFGYVLSSVHNFCAKELSRCYLDGIKDRMYCDGKDWPSRRSAQQACLHVLATLVRLLAPILPHTAEETYARIPVLERLDTVHAEVLPLPSPERLETIEASPLQVRFSQIFTLRADCFAAFETWKAANGVKDSQDAVVVVINSAEQLQALRQTDPSELANLWKFSWVTLEEGEPGFQFALSELPKCDRCRLRRPDVAEARGHMLSARDRRALGWE